MPGNFLLSLMSTLLALALVLGLAWLLLRLLRDRLPLAARGAAGPASDDTLRFVRALPVGPKERVVLVEHRGQRWLLGVAAGGVNVLAHWPDAAAAPPASVPEAGASAAPKAPTHAPFSAPDCGQP